jgi:cyclic pyranopterin phosphate synthase
MLPARRPLAHRDAVSVARLWSATGGKPEVELGALEPLLWREQGRGPADLVRGLKDAGMRVTMTTNASRLASQAGELKAAGLDLVRVSWHTTDAARYQEISGHGDYRAFREALTAAASAGLRISFNRVLLRDATDDLPEQLDFIEAHGYRLKLYDLLWTAEIAPYYRDIYQDWRPIVREHVLPRTRRVERVGRAIGRRRLRFHLAGGAFVEVKLGDELDRSQEPCLTCPHRAVCMEEFGDYVRVEPELDAYFCYLRRDVGFSFRELLDRPDAESALRAHLASAVGDRADALLRTTALRYVVTPFCNFNCFIPGTSVSWCHKTEGDYSFPGRPRLAVHPAVS